MAGKPRVLFVDKSPEMNEWAVKELGECSELEIEQHKEFSKAEGMMTELGAAGKKYDAVIVNPELPPADIAKGSKLVTGLRAFDFLKRFQKTHPDTKIIIFHGVKPNPLPEGMAYVNSLKPNAFVNVRKALGVQPKRLTRRARLKQAWKRLHKRVRRRV